MFECRDYPIPIKFRCDGVKQCVPDGLDEIDCPTTTTVSPKLFQCRDYQIPVHFKCDGTKQCVPDGSDEINCPQTTVATTTVATPPGKLEKALFQ